MSQFHKVAKLDNYNELLSLLKQEWRGNIPKIFKEMRLKQLESLQERQQMTSTIL